jgi:O-antigen/teichoic acid export membrane protein
MMSVNNQLCYTHVVERIRDVFSDPLMRHNAVFFVGSMAVAVLNYAYHPVISRLLSVEEFGEVTATFSLLSQTGVVVGIFNMVAIHITSNSSRYGARKMLEEIYGLVFFFQALLALCLLVASPWLMAEMRFVSIFPFVLVALSMFLSLPYALESSRLQGKKNFARLSVASFITASSKLMTSALFVLVGFGVGGAIGGILASQVVTLWYVLHTEKRGLSFFPKRIPVFDAALFSELKFALLILVSTGLVTVLYTFDTVIAKFLFEPEVAGQYAAIAVIARIVFFATASIAGVLLPSVSLGNDAKENYRVLHRSAILVLSIGGSVVVLMSLMPELVISLLLGSKYLTFAHLLPELSFVLLLASLVNLLVYFLIALRRFVLIPIALCGIVVLLVLTTSHHNSVETVIHQFTLANGFVLASLVGYLFYDRTQSRTQTLDRHSTL